AGLAEIRVPDIVTVLAKHRPDVVLLMSGANGFDAAARERLIRTLLAHFRGRLLVSTIPPQCPPRTGFEQVAAYNAVLPPLVTALQVDGHAVTLVGYKSGTGRLEDAVFIFKNSWGADWGQGGYGMVTYGYLSQHLNDAVLLEVQPARL
ncbi:MAG: C1 family peptidase, partial [Opitutae bacterium]